MYYFSLDGKLIIHYMKTLLQYIISHILYSARRAAITTAAQSNEGNHTTLHLAAS